jgi:hypothetical protein
MMSCLRSKQEYGSVKQVNLQKQAKLSDILLKPRESATQGIGDIAVRVRATASRRHSPSLLLVTKRCAPVKIPAFRIAL